MAELIAERRDERGSKAHLVGPDDDDRFDHRSKDDPEVAWDEHEGMLEWGALGSQD